MGPRLATLLAAGVPLVLGTCLGAPKRQPEARAATPAAQGVARGRDPVTGVFFTGSDNGYLDACGCDDGLLGGLPRRHTLLQIEGYEQSEALVLSNGRLVQGADPLDRAKLETIVFAMQQIGYDAIALTERELAFGRPVLAELATLLGEECPFVATNLIDGVAAGGNRIPLPVVPAVVRQVQGASVLVLAGVAPSRAPRFSKADPDLSVADLVPALERELGRHAGVEHVVLLAQADEEEAKALAAKLPRLDLVIIQGPDDEDLPAEAAVRVGGADLVTTGLKGKFLGHYRFAGGVTEAEYSRLPIHDGLEKSESVRDILGNYRDLLPLDQPIRRYLEQRTTASGAAYAGAEEASCAGCHPEAWAIWSRSAHARAWQTLVDQDLPDDGKTTKGKQRHAIWDPDCVKCHVTGFGEITGYAGLERERPDAPLVNVSCESCHGPAGDHAQRASEKNDYTYPGGRVPRLDDPACETLCVTCHDPDNSPRFDRREYWKGFAKGRQIESIAHGKE